MRTPLRHRSPRAVAHAATACALATFAAGSVGVAAGPDDATAPAARREYGTPVRVGNGRARTYVVVDAQRGGRTVELGVALDERAMEGLRAPDPSRGEHGDMDMFTLPVPARSGTAFQFVELDWNPKGHGAPYLDPHFDFHFYTISEAERHAIMPDDPRYAARAANEPPAAAIPAHYVNPATLLGLPPAATAVPMMGMHWIDPRSPELQALVGNPGAYRPFTRTFLYGAWDGRLTFMEPMISRAYLMAKRDAADAARDEVVPIPTSPSYPAGGFRPNAYRIAWDARAREYHVALVREGDAP